MQTGRGNVQQTVRRIFGGKLSRGMLKVDMYVKNCLGLTRQSGKCLGELSGSDMRGKYLEVNCLAGKLVRRELSRVNVEGTVWQKCRGNV